MIAKIEEIINEGIKDGYDIDSIHEMFLETINKYSNINGRYIQKTKKTKKARPKKICRPVLLISDSSCDEFNR